MKDPVTPCAGKNAFRYTGVCCGSTRIKDKRRDLFSDGCVWTSDI